MAAYVGIHVISRIGPDPVAARSDERDRSIVDFGGVQPADRPGAEAASGVSVCSALARGTVYSCWTDYSLPTWLSR
jgi:hypothetical protein